MIVPFFWVPGGPLAPELFPLGQHNLDRMASTTNQNPQVDDWFEKLDHPLKAAMLATRRVILASDSRILETIKWSTPTFEYKGNLASFQPKAKQFVSLLFHRGAEIPGSHPRLEGDSPLARVMRFRDASEVEKNQESLRDVVRAWCDWKDHGGR